MKYYVKEDWIFNLESMQDLCRNLIYDVEDGKLKFPIKAADRRLCSEEDIRALMEECSSLEAKAKSGAVEESDYNRIGEIVFWRITRRFEKCRQTLGIREAEKCFDEL